MQSKISKTRWYRIGFIVLAAIITGLLSALATEEFKTALYGIIGDKNVAMLVLAVVYNILAEVKNSIAIKKAALGSRFNQADDIVLL